MKLLLFVVSHEIKYDLANHSVTLDGQHQSWLFFNIFDRLLMGGFEVFERLDRLSANREQDVVLEQAGVTGIAGVLDRIDKHPFGALKIEVGGFVFIDGLGGKIPALELQQIALDIAFFAGVSSSVISAPSRTICMFTALRRSSMPRRRRTWGRSSSVMAVTTSSAIFISRSPAWNPAAPAGLL